MSISFDEVSLLGKVHVVAIEELQEIKREDKSFEESEAMYKVVYVDEGELLDNIHSCVN